MKSRTTARLGIFIIFSVCCLITIPTSRAETTTFVPAEISTPHPYPDRASLEWELETSEILGVRVHFVEIITEEGEDFVIVSAENASYQYTGHYGDFWTPWFAASSVKISFMSDGWGTAYGFDVDGYEVKTAPNWAGWGSITIGIIVVMGCLLAIFYIANRHISKIPPTWVIFRPKPRRLILPKLVSNHKPVRQPNAVQTEVEIPPSSGVSSKILHVNDARTFIKEMKDRPIYVEYHNATPSQRRRLKEKNPRLARLVQRIHRLEVWALRNKV